MEFIKKLLGRQMPKALALQSELSPLLTGFMGECLYVSDGASDIVSPFLRSLSSPERVIFWRGEAAQSFPDMGVRALVGQAARPVADRFFHHVVIDANHLNVPLEATIAAHWVSLVLGSEKESYLYVIGDSGALCHLEKTVYEQKAARIEKLGPEILQIRPEAISRMPANLFKLALCQDPLHIDHHHCLAAIEEKDYDVAPHISSSHLEDILCPFARLKIRIICIRRRLGDHYPHFHAELERNFEYYLKFLTTRWLISVIDTIADFGNSVERRNAMMISLFCNLEKISQTLRLFTGHRNHAAETEVALKMREFIQPIWDGMTTYGINTNANMIENLGQRLWSLMDETIILRRILFEIIMRMRQDDLNSFRLLNTHHPRDLFSDLLNGYEAP